VKRIYHFHHIDCYYLKAEDIQDLPPGVGFLAHSTDIAPPPLDDVPNGYIPVFDKNTSKWRVVEDAFWRPKITEHNYDAGRKMESYRPISLSWINDFPVYPQIHIFNPMLSVLANCQRVQLIHNKFTQCLKKHELMKQHMISGAGMPMWNSGQEGDAESVSLLYETKLEIETMVFLMKKVLDILFQLAGVLVHYERINEEKKLRYTEIGQLFRDGKSGSSELDQMFLGSNAQYAKDSTHFLKVINDLFNAYKHSLINEEAYSLVSWEIYPTVVAFHAYGNNFGHPKGLIYHNHNIFHLMMGFQDAVLRVLKNQKIYKNNIMPSL